MVYHLLKPFKNLKISNQLLAMAYKVVLLYRSSVIFNQVLLNYKTITS